MYTAIGSPGQLRNEHLEHLKKVSTNKKTNKSSIGVKLINLPDLGLCKYKGELDKEGKACGRGEALQLNVPYTNVVGTFFDNLEHGISELY